MVEGMTYIPLSSCCEALQINLIQYLLGGLLVL